MRGTPRRMKLKRREVAARMRKSIATVRRLEGHVLHPQRDARGTYWFDSEDVERLRERPNRGKEWARSDWLRRRMRSQTDRALHHPAAPQTLLDACEMIAMAARRGRFTSRGDVIIPFEAFSAFLDAIALDVDLEG